MHLNYFKIYVFPFNDRFFNFFITNTSTLSIKYNPLPHKKDDENPGRKADI